MDIEVDGRSTRSKDSYFYKDLTGLRFGKLTVKEIAGRTKHGNLIWKCKCSCGKCAQTPSGKLISGKKKDCGCETKARKAKAASKHGITVGGKPRTFVIWNGMKARCLNPKSISYKNYGGRGISICEEWLSFENFHNWALMNGYADGLQIDRIDNNGNYCPGNCRWVDKGMNARNQRSTHYIEIDGERKTVTDWCKALKISKSTAYRYLNQSDLAFVEYCKNKTGQVYFVNKFLAKNDA